MESKGEHPRPTGAPKRMDGLLVFWEDGREIISSYGSDDNCDGRGLMAHIERCRQSDASAKQTERAQAKTEAKRIETADKAALGDLFGALATLIRKSVASAKRTPTRPKAKRDKRRRRRLKAD